MRERFHIFLREARELPGLDPGPSPDIGDTVFAFTLTGQIVARGAGVFARELDLQDAVDAEGFVAKAFDCICRPVVASVLILSEAGNYFGEVWSLQEHTGYLLLGKLSKVVDLPLIRRAATVPKEQPLQRLAPLHLILEPKNVVLVRKL